MVSLLSALTHMHSSQCVHRDIKLDNLLLKRVDDLSSLKIADFGLACDLMKESLGRRCGSTGYIAPEIILGRAQSSKVDVFSVGVIAHILLSGFAPFRGSKENVVLRLNADCCLNLETKYWEHISEPAKEFERRCMSREPLGRPFAQEALSLSWFTKLKSIPKVPSRVVIHVSEIKESAMVNSQLFNESNIRRTPQESARVLMSLAGNGPPPEMPHPITPTSSLLAVSNMKTVQGRLKSLVSTPITDGNTPISPRAPLMTARRAFEPALLPVKVEDTKIVLTPQVEKKRFAVMRRLKIDI
mmetsp:Transcript_15493/g.28110  ORF Transcript_15493/g.28110 Transcript_15493/m.28110 type:complete len:300 (+) Transcript_15493:1616-2515(+)